MEIKEFVIHPYQGVDAVMEDESVRKIRFGMTREQVRSLFEEKPKTFVKNESDELAIDDFKQAAVQMSYKEPNLLETIEFSRSARLSFEGKSLLRLPYERILAWFKTIDSGLKVKPTNGLTSFKYGIALWAPNADAEGSEYIAESVLVFEPGYYDK